MHYHANAHVPGYLPESEDVPTFDSASEAWAYLADELEAWWDHEYASSDDSEHLAIDARYTDVHAFLHNAPSEPGSQHLAGPSSTHLGYIYEVTACDGSDCDTDSDER